MQNPNIFGTMMKEKLGIAEDEVLEGEPTNVVSLYEGRSGTAWVTILIWARGADQLRAWDLGDAFGVRTRGYSLIRIYTVPARLNPDNQFGAQWCDVVTRWVPAPTSGAEPPRGTFAEADEPIEEWLAGRGSC